MFRPRENPLTIGGKQVVWIQVAAHGKKSVIVRLGWIRENDHNNANGFLYTDELSRSS
jgi:hypothetical protein